MRSLIDDKKKYAASLLFLGALIGLTFYMFLKGNDLGELSKVIQGVNPWYILLGVAAMFGFIACEGICLKMIVNSLGQKLSFLRSYKYSFISFYYSAITPSASGGQPMQLYYMSRDNINLSISSLTILILVVVYQVAELGFALVMFLLKPAFVTENVTGMGLLLIYGIAINVILLFLFLGAVFSKTMIQRVANWGVRLLARMKIVKNPEAVMAKVNEQVEEYRKGAVHIRKHPSILWKALGLTVLQLGCQFIVPFFVYRAFGLHEYGLMEVLALQAILTLAVGSLPLPGAVGASESGFMVLFRVFFSAGTLLPAMMLSRGISFYLMLLISGVVSIGAHVLSTKARNKMVKVKKPDCRAADTVA